MLNQYMKSLVKNTSVVCDLWLPVVQIILSTRSKNDGGKRDDAKGPKKLRITAFFQH